MTTPLTTEQQPTPNLAIQYLLVHGETVADWKGVCGELANAIMEDGDKSLYIEGDIPWKYHMVLLRDNLVHDAWCPGPALPVREYLTRMFGSDAYVEVAVNGDDIFMGYCGDFRYDH